MASGKPRTRKKQNSRSKSERLPKEQGGLLAALGASPSGDEIPLMVAARANALDALGFDVKAAQLVEGARRLSAQADQVRLKVLQTAKEKPACSKGCSYCCSHKVGVTVPEVLAIVAHLRTLSRTARRREQEGRAVGVGALGSSRTAKSRTLAFRARSCTTTGVAASMTYAHCRVAVGFRRTWSRARNI